MQPARFSSTDLDLPFGYKFDPTAGELVRHYLIPKLKGEKLPSDYVIEIADVCASDPIGLPSNQLRYANKDIRYFFTPDPRENSVDSQRRTTPTGYWQVYKDGILIEDIGLKTKLQFYGLYGNRTDWRMFEYRCHPARLPTASTSTNMNIIICKVKLMVKKDEEILVEDVAEGE